MDQPVHVKRRHAARNLLVGLALSAAFGTYSLSLLFQPPLAPKSTVSLAEVALNPSFTTQLAINPPQLHAEDLKLAKLDHTALLPFRPMAAPFKYQPLPPLPAQPSNSESIATYPAPTLEDEPKLSPSTLNGDEPLWQETTVNNGDTLTRIFSRFDLSGNEVGKIISFDQKHEKLLQKLSIGQKLYLHVANDELRALRYRVSPLLTVTYQRNSNGDFTLSKDERQHRVQTNIIAATINDSLYKSGLNAGLSDNIILELAGIFAWDIDFALDIRKGDRFSVLYEELFLDGKKVGDGDILAAEFINNGKPHRAVRHTTADGGSVYYTPEGRSLRQAFVRSPVDFRRISSGFQQERFHPILGVKRPHKGVDYAAAIGTPVWASGDGKVEFIGNKSGYGNTIVLQHRGQFSTLYAHLSRFKSNLNRGDKVIQGQTIGYVGKTGLATGPHLHYEFRVAGEHRNPLTVKLPDAEPIPNKERPTFIAQAKERMNLLERYHQSQLAAATATTPKASLQ